MSNEYYDPSLNAYVREFESPEAAQAYLNNYRVEYQDPNTGKLVDSKSLSELFDSSGNFTPPESWGDPQPFTGTLSPAGGLPGGNSGEVKDNPIPLAGSNVLGNILGGINATLPTQSQASGLSGINPMLLFLMLSGRGTDSFQQLIMLKVLGLL